MRRPGPGHRLKAAPWAVAVTEPYQLRPKAAVLSGRRVASAAAFRPHMADGSAPPLKLSLCHCRCHGAGTPDVPCGNPGYGNRRNSRSAAGRPGYPSAREAHPGGCRPTGYHGGVDSFWPPAGVLVTANDTEVEEPLKVAETEHFVEAEHVVIVGPRIPVIEPAYREGPVLIEYRNDWL